MAMVLKLATKPVAGAKTYTATELSKKVGYGSLSLDPFKIFKAGLENPISMPIGGAGAVVTKTITTNITKGTAGGLLKTVAVGAGALGLGMLLGGTKQETTQTPTQAPTQATAQDLAQKARDMIARMQASATTKQTILTTPTVTPSYNVTAGGNVDIGGVSTLTTTENYAYTGVDQGFLGQLAGMFQIPTQTPTQTTTSEQKTDNSLILMLIALAIGVFFLTKK